MLLINQLKINIKAYEISSNLNDIISQKLRINKIDILDYTILRRSIDARRKNNIIFVFNVLVEVKNENKVLSTRISNVTKYIDKDIKNDYSKYNYLKNKKICIIGFGPAGIFSALTFARAGVNVTVYERGEDVDQRMKTIRRFETDRVLNTESNIQFGEGGAGTYSDGKLTNRKKDPLGSWLFQELVKAGAPKEIMYDSSPHIGSDKLIGVVKHIRKEIINLGSYIHFNSKVTNIKPLHEGLEITVNGEQKYFDDCILAIGHSSRDTISMLYNNKFAIKQKPFAVGFRIEHTQKLINKAQYGFEETHHILGPAEYKLTYRAQNNKGVYTFCMCPGGIVVPSTSEEGMLVTNGMSEYKRDKINANSALVITVDENDFGSTHPLAGIEFQRELEKRAYILGGSNYNAPIQRVEDFILNRTTDHLGKVLPSYPIGVTYANLRTIFDEKINRSFISALNKMGNELDGFNHPDALLTGIESRTSSPVRILRDQLTLQSISTKHLYPAGEGAGYAGGIVSAAIDGIKVAHKILESIRKE